MEKALNSEVYAISDEAYAIWYEVYAFALFKLK